MSIQEGVDLNTLNSAWGSYQDVKENFKRVSEQLKVELGLITGNSLYDSVASEEEKADVTLYNGIISDIETAIGETL